MSEFIEDALQNVIQLGIKEDIEVTLSNKRLRAATILIFAGMDAMAFLDMPAGQDDVTGADFIRWSGKYIRFPCKEQLTGEDLYGARCSMLHRYGLESKSSRKGNCRMVGYLDQAVPEVRFAPQIDSTLVMVSIPGLKDAFFKGMNKFLMTAYSESAKAAVVDQRLKTMAHSFAMNPL